MQDGTRLKRNRNTSQTSSPSPKHPTISPSLCLIRGAEMTLPQCETAGLSRFYFGNSADSRRNCPLLAVQAFVILHGISCQSIIWPTSPSALTAWLQRLPRRKAAACCRCTPTCSILKQMPRLLRGRYHEHPSSSNRVQKATLSQTSPLQRSNRSIPVEPRPFFHERHPSWRFDCSLVPSRCLLGESSCSSLSTYEKTSDLCSEAETEAYIAESCSWDVARAYFLSRRFCVS